MDPNKIAVSVTSFDADPNCLTAKENADALFTSQDVTLRSKSLLTLPCRSIEELRNSSVTLYFKRSSYENCNDDKADDNEDHTKALDNEIEDVENDIDLDREFDWVVDSGINTLSPTTPQDGPESFIPRPQNEASNFAIDHISTRRISALGSRASGGRISHVSASQMSLKSCIIPEWLFDENGATKISFGNLDLIVAVIAIVAYLLDVASDLNVAALHFRRRQFWWFALTVSFILLPSIAMVLFNKYFWEPDEEKKTSCCWKIVIIFFQGTMLLRLVSIL